jgi:hypothetical protein
LALEWEDVNLDLGVALSRGRGNKSKKDMRHKIAGAASFLRELPRIDPRYSLGITTLGRSTRRFTSSNALPVFICRAARNTGTHPPATCTGSTT